MSAQAGSQDEHTTFTGERLHAGNRLFGVDLARHRAAYQFALERARGHDVVELGSGAGYGASELAAVAGRLVAVDRIRPDAESREAATHFLRADLRGIPLAPAAFDLVVSFQVIEHLEDPSDYLREIGRLMKPEGSALITTPNWNTSDRENPFHVHEYRPDELKHCLENYFGDVEMLGIGTGPRVAPYFEARLQRIRRITRIDPLGLRRRLPQSLVEWLFAKAALLVRRGIASDDGLPDATVDDFPIAPVDDECIDLLAVCRRPLA